MASFTIGGETFDLVDSKLTFAEARAIEKYTGHTFQELTANEAIRGSAASTQALIWVSMKRRRPEMKFSDLDDVAIDEIEWSTDEEPEPDPTPGEDSTQTD